MATRTKRSRAETERRLIDVALDLILHNGVLAGLNLREVADGAGVNRGNIYHYFGSRRELLRAAIARRFEAVAESLSADEKSSLEELDHGPARPSIPFDHAERLINLGLAELSSGRLDLTIAGKQILAESRGG